MRQAAVLAVLALAPACGPKESAGPPVGISTKPGEALPSPNTATRYAFDPIDEKAVSSDANLGKPTVIAFITTGDINGQAQVSYLVNMAKHDADKVNYALVALHPRREVILVDAYRKTLGVEFPVALGEPGTTTSGGPFGEIPAVPTVVVLDRDGRIVWKHTGLAKHEEIRNHMRGL